MRNEPKTTDSGKPTGAAIADAPSVVEAIEALSTVELVKLERYARFRMRALGGQSFGRDAEDLLREAITASLSGARRWRPEAVSFFGHLVGVMRSISSHWAERAAHESRFVDEARWFGADGAPDAERLLGMRRTLRAIEDSVAGDAELGRLISGFHDGLAPAEIREENGWSRPQYDAALKRLRRAVSRLCRERGESTSA
jgi:DNA-directed RNA polymerase specialized sigma24 family protein